MEEISIREFTALAGLLISMFGMWYKINQDINKKVDDLAADIGRKSDDTRRAASKDIEEVKHAIANIRMVTVTRQEHDSDIESVKTEVRSFRDEVRDDIRTLSTALNSRFDTMMQRMFEMKTSPSKD